ncbi:RNA 2',3'-cyclic phosphodiesterase [Paenibacillus sp. sgz302251]|uniref:RNA 2',3'-cyclic phosphodiesterase n=1 Tax=Paenibacillus sp. sgz302251 TaxID=3414493 RepID=UPI003C79C971
MEKAINKENTLRLFVALPLKGHAAEALNQWVSTEKERLPFRKWVHAADYHITLQFLGDVSADKTGTLQGALREVQAAQIELVLSKGGAFGQPKAPRVLWSGVSGQLEGLVSLHNKIIEQTRPLGFIPEDRPFSPHITLARNYVGKKDMPMEALASLPTGFGWTAEHFVLMRTHMHASPMYEAIGTFPLR